MSNLRLAFNEFWDSLTDRERRLGYGVIGVAVAMVLVTTIRMTTDHLYNLDRTIDALEDELVEYRLRLARRSTVDREFEEVAAQHSSEWTEAEIQDRLRQEIYRLSSKLPPPLDESGIPIKTASSSGNLVEIPALQQGRLEEGDQGYREYSLTFRVPSVELTDLFDFIERLQGSPQSLRVDGFEMTRGSGESKVEATLEITRTIVAGARDAGPAEAPVPESDLTMLDPAKWAGEGVAVVTSGNALAARADTDGSFYTIRNLPSGVIYDLIVDVTASGAGTMGIALQDGGELMGDVAELRADGKPYRYHLQFAVPGEAGERRRTRLPVFNIEAGSQLTVHNFVLRSAEMTPDTGNDAG